MSATCWIVFHSDLTSGLTAIGNFSISYADDFISCATNAVTLQRGLNFIENWCQSWEISLAANKCFLAEYGPGPHADVTLSGVPVARLDGNYFKSLGVVLDLEQTFSPHAKAIIAKAKSVSATILRCFHSKDIHLLFAAFQTYVIPHLEYASCVWNSISPRDSDAIESVLIDFTRRIFRRARMSTLNYAERLKFLDTISLRARREATDLSFAHAVISGEHFCPVIQPAPLPPRASSRLAPRAIHNPHASRQAQRMPHNRVSKAYNALPARMRTMRLDTFRSASRHYCSFPKDSRRDIF